MRSKEQQLTGMYLHDLAVNWEKRLSLSAQHSLNSMQTMCAGAEDEEPGFIQLEVMASREPSISTPVHRKMFFWRRRKVLLCGGCLEDKRQWAQGEKRELQSTCKEKLFHREYIAKQQCRLPREFVQSPSLEIFKKWTYKALEFFPQF